MGIQQMMLGTSPGGDTYWIKSDGKDTAGYYHQYDGVHVDSSGNVYTYGRTNEPWDTSNPWRYTRVGLNKYDKHGTNIFYKRFSSNTNAQEPTQNGLVGLSDGSLVFTTKSTQASVKVNSSGTILYKKGYGTSSSSLDGNTGSISVNSSDQTLYTGYGASSGSGTINVFRINSNGTLSGDWQVSVSSSGNYGTSFSATGTDSNGNVYIIGSRGQSGTYDKDGYIMKLNSSMAIQWQHTLGASGYYPIDQWHDLAFDSSDNIYCVGTTRTSNKHYGWIVKYNSGGILQWQKKFGDGTQNLYFWSISIDGDDDIYVQGDVDTYGKQPFWVKLNTSGAVQYQRSMREYLSGANHADHTRVMKMFGDALYIVGRRYIGYQKHFGWIAKVPKAGIDTGTYSNKYIIEQPSYTMSNTSFTTDRVTVAFTISEVTNKNTYNANYAVSTSSWPEDVSSIYDVDFGQ